MEYEKQNCSGTGQAIKGCAENFISNAARSAKGATSFGSHESVGKKERKWTIEKIQQIRSIKESKSYKKTHGTWELYIRNEWGVSRTFVSRLLRGNIQIRYQIQPEQRWRIWERDNFTCAYCYKRKFLSVDHIVPQSLGGLHDDSNLVTACITCNIKKTNY